MSRTNVITGVFRGIKGEVVKGQKWKEIKCQWGSSLPDKTRPLVAVPTAPIPLPLTRAPAPRHHTTRCCWFM